MTDAEAKGIVGLVAPTDLIRATARGIGGYPRLVYKVEDVSSIPERLAISFVELPRAF
jgi:hypothetical protein